MEEASNTIRTLWHGSPLSVYERLSLLSFLRHGHKVEIYTYGQLDVPPGVHLCDASSVLPQSEVFSYSRGPQKGSFAAFSNLFRYKILFEKGGIWADLDFLCLGPLHELPDACLGRMVWESREQLNVALMKFPVGNLICKTLYEKAKTLGQNIDVGEASNALVSAVLGQGEVPCTIFPVPAFYPIHWRETWKLFDPDETTYCETQVRSSFCVHWWNTAFRYIGLSKEALPPKGSFLHKHAEIVFRNLELKAWPIETLKNGINNFRNLGVG